VLYYQGVTNAFINLSNFIIAYSTDSMKENKVFLIIALATVGLITTIFAGTLWLANNRGLPKLRSGANSQNSTAVSWQANLQRQ